MTEPTDHQPVVLPADASIIARLVAVMDDVGAIGRHGRMTHGEKYAYRRNDDVLDAVQPALVRHGVVAVPTVLAAEYRDKTTKNGAAQVWCSLRVEWTFYGAAGDSVTAVVVGEAADTSDKATNKAHTASQKVALTQVLSLPYSSDDPDDDRQQIGAPGAARPQQANHPGGSRRGQENANQGPISGPQRPASTEAVEAEWDQADEASIAALADLSARFDALPADLAGRVVGRVADRVPGFPVRDPASLGPSWLRTWDGVIRRAEEAAAAAASDDDRDDPAEYGDLPVGGT